MPPAALAPQRADDFLAGGGELGALIRAHDWSSNPLGEPASWPRSLKTAVRIMLTSRQPIWIGWGPELSYLYNDPYKAIIGGKHPWALGKPTATVWSDIWPTIGPLLSTAMTGDGTYVESQLLIMERNGYPEETYYTFSYSPIPGDDGAPAGIICANTDETQRVIGERQLALLREVAARTAQARTPAQACTRCVEALATDARDLPFALIYLAAPGEDGYTLMSATGLPQGHPAAPPQLAPGGVPWDFTGLDIEPRVVKLDAAYAPWPAGPWAAAAREAVLLPLPASGDSGSRGVLVAGLSPVRLLDGGYRDFLVLVAKQACAAVANAESYQAEQRRAEALAQIDRAKTLFFSNVSHEFRTPLTLMLGPLEEALAEREQLPAHHVELLDLAHRNSQRLLRLVNTLLDFSRIEAGRAGAAFQPTALAEFTRELASNFELATSRAGLQFTIDCPPLPRPVYVDHGMWEKVVLNLLSNAFKFTFEGGIAVRMRPSEDGKQVLLMVADTGVGIPAHELPRVFERFHRVQGQLSRSFEGSGIGLALVQELVRQHGGSIHADSAPGVGTTFTVALPFGYEHLPAGQVGAAPRLAESTGAGSYAEEALRWLPEAQAGEQAPPQPHNSARIVVADDNPDMRDYVCRLLGAHWEVVPATDGEEALASVRERKPDLLITDVMMPKLDGFGLLRAIRDDAALGDLPVMMLSARAGEEARVGGLEAGADDYLVKPFSARELVARVRSNLELAAVRRAAGAALRESEARLRNIADQLAQRVAEAGEQDQRKNEFLATLAHELRNPLAPLRNGVELIKRFGAAQPQRVPDIVAMMERQLAHMVRLVDDLMDIARVSRGKVELRQERVPLAGIVQSALESCRPQAERAGHSLAVDVPDAPVWLLGDPTRLAQVLGNVLNNAVKYTPPRGHIALRARVEGSDAVIEVQDDGIGIAPELAGHMFDLFVQGPQTLAAAQGGLGIGLSLVRQLVEMHGGSVALHSEGSGRGTTVRITLPLAPAEAAPRAVAPAAGGQASGSGRRVLVVDDNVDAANSLGLLLAVGGHETCVVHSGAEALSAASRFRPQLVLLDIGLPDLSGYEVATRLRQAQDGSPLRIVALTGWGNEEAREKSASSGFDLHLTKPVQMDVLQQLLREGA